MHRLENNCSSFLAILKPLAQTNGDLQNHLTSPVARNASEYLGCRYDVREGKVWKT